MGWRLGSATEPWSEAKQGRERETDFDQHCEDGKVDLLLDVA